MCFEVKDRDLLARIGVVETKSGSFETPALLPVVNPAVQAVSPREMAEFLGLEAVITNAYIMMRRFGREAISRGVHDVLGFRGVVMTDSGAYQLLVYGRVDVGPDDIVAYQEAIGTDIAVILDVPTGWTESREEALRTVLETAERGNRLWSTKEREDILWVGPIQGGRFPDLISLSARLMSSMPFDLHALGSPTPVMEAYKFDLLVDMIMAARTVLPPDRPLHLFGAGHPMMFSLAVALGCDMFDSAAYAIYARDGRYMTEHGTSRLEEMGHLPCECPVCAGRSPEDLLDLPEEERVRLLALHNLYVCVREIKAIKEAIREGRLWEHLVMRAASHPSLMAALRRLAGRYRKLLERGMPTSRKKGIFISTALDAYRPDMVRYRERLIKNFRPAPGLVLLLMPYPGEKPFSRTELHDEFFSLLSSALGPGWRSVHLCLYGPPFGLVPVELDQVHPLSQFEFSAPEEAFYEPAGEIVEEYVASKPYSRVVLVSDGSRMADIVEEACRRAALRRGLGLTVLREPEPWSRRALSRLFEKLSALLGSS